MNKHADSYLYSFLAFNDKLKVALCCLSCVLGISVINLCVGVCVCATESLFDLDG